MVQLRNQLVKEWHPTKNGISLPTDFSAGSGKKMWWQCELDHEWQAAILNRSNGAGCPVCTNRRILAGFNDLVTTSPSLVTEWNYSKNGDLLPTQVSQGSNRKVWWVDSYGHEWKTAISNRVNGTGCPFCANKAVLRGFNDLATTDAALAKEFHPTLNNEVTVQMLTRGINKSFWWFCEAKHEYQASVANRTQGDGCPFCSGHQVIVGETDLATTNPSLSAQWDNEKNGKLTPQTVSAGSSRRVWWKCEEKHSWFASVSSRSQGANCPYCWGRFAILGQTDLATTHPQCASLWHPTKNGKLTPGQVTAGSNKKVWWRGDCQHDWEDTVVALTSNRGCPVCANRRILVGYNDLATTYPTIAGQLHPTKNRAITAETVTAGSDKRLWWVCDVNSTHEWEAAVYTRKADHGCPVCWSSNIVSSAEHELYEFLTGLGLKVIQSDRKALGNRQEIDLYLPELKVGIEYNGVYWHSEAAGKKKSYHYDKWLAAQSVGIQLIQIWENDWNFSKSAVLNYLSKRLTPAAASQIANVQVEPITSTAAKVFLEKEHLRGFVSGATYLGIKNDDNKLTAVMICDDGGLIVRYAQADGCLSLIRLFQKYLGVSLMIVLENDLAEEQQYLGKGFTVVSRQSPAFKIVNTRGTELGASQTYRVWDSGSVKLSI